MRINLKTLPLDKQRALLPAIHRHRQYLATEGKKWDINLDEIETIPIDVFARADAQQGNWGEQLLIPPAIRARIRTECKYPVVVKVFDTAFLIDHQDMQKGQLPGKNYTEDPNGPDQHGHGTHVADIIGGRNRGIAWDLVDIGLLRIQPTQVLNRNGSGNFNAIAGAENTELPDAKQRIANGERVLHNYSLGGGTALVPNVEAALKAASEAGVVHIAAAGNNGGTVIYPAMSNYMLAVSAFDQGQNLAGFSSRGPAIETSKPGVAIFAAHKNNTYATLSGTSMAAPFMTGAIAIAMSEMGSSSRT
jgi:subtilisin family serine protease